MSIPGIGPAEPITTNEHGGTQSALAYRFDLLPARALFDVSKVLHEGAEKHGANNWRRIASRDHLNHALAHIFAFLEGDEQDEHLSHATCRLLFAMGVEDVHKDEREEAAQEAKYTREQRDWYSARCEAFVKLINEVRENDNRCYGCKREYSVDRLCISCVGVAEVTDHWELRMANGDGDDE